MTDLAGFGPRLRRERERRGISLLAIANRTKIGIALLEDLERGDLVRWPSGIFRRAFVRAYAQAVGLDPETLVAEVGALFPDGGAPAPAKAAEKIEKIEKIKKMAPDLSAVRTVERPAPATPLELSARETCAAADFRLTLEEPQTGSGTRPTVARNRAMAALADAALLLAGGGLGTLVAGLAGLWPGVAVGSVALVAGVLAVGRTPGGWLFLGPAPGRLVSAEAVRGGKRRAIEQPPGTGVRRHAARRVEHRRPY
jgi:transcriptional regulator with XRE-family HTH domain